jgi:signal transduction histidine kinase
MVHERWRVRDRLIGKPARRRLSAFSQCGMCRAMEGGTFMANASDTLARRSERVSGIHRISFPSEMLVMTLHDLRSPLWTLKLGLEQLNRDVPMPPERRRNAVDRMARSVDRMSELIGGLMTAVELHEHELPVPLEPVELGQIVEEVVHALEPRAERLGSTITVTSTLRVCGRWNSLRLWQIVHNLVCNALQHGKSSVRVHVWQQADHGYVAVEDDGPGLEPWEQARVFERNWRGEHAMRTSLGHGLGLWIVRRLALALGGQVEVQSQRGRGARFVVRLPSEP